LPQLAALRDIAISMMRPEDWDAVRAIYIEGMATGNSTFEQSAPDSQTCALRIHCERSIGAEIYRSAIYETSNA
jgi:L-amino acid N-acyltransferase YncA